MTIIILQYSVLGYLFYVPYSVFGDDWKLDFK